jgi:hypothetical protein
MGATPVLVWLPLGLEKEEQIMTTIFCLVLFVVLVILSLTAQRWLFQDADQVYDPEWERYQQRYD